MSDLLEHLRAEFSDEDIRYGYAEAYLNAFVAAQLKALREERGMTQEQLADAIETKQSGISRLENANYSSWKVETLRKLARALGVRLKISFEEFGTLVHEVENFRKERLSRRAFEKDPVFRPAVESLEAKPPQRETIPPIPVMSQQDAEQKPVVPSEDSNPDKGRLIMMPRPRSPLGGINPNPTPGQTDLSQLQNTK